MMVTNTIRIKGMIYLLGTGAGLGTEASNQNEQTSINESMII